MNHVSFRDLKAGFEKKDQEDREFRGMVAKVLDISRLKNLSRSKRGVILVAGDKAHAQELFLQRETLRQALACEVIIK